jgi:hypothetical protein
MLCMWASAVLAEEQPLADGLVGAALGHERRRSAATMRIRFIDQEVTSTPRLPHRPHERATGRQRPLALTAALRKLAATLLLYDLGIRRSKVTRFLFGLRPPPQRRARTSPAS